MPPKRPPQKPSIRKATQQRSPNEPTRAQADAVFRSFQKSLDAQHKAQSNAPQPPPRQSSTPNTASAITQTLRRLASSKQQTHDGNNNQSPKPSTSNWAPFFGRITARVRQAGRICRTVALVVVPVSLISLAATEHLAQVMWVNGPSMTPYLNEDFAEMQTSKDAVLVKRWKPAEGLRRGMVVTFPSYLDPSKPAIKRIIALPGDRVTPRGTGQSPPSTTSSSSESPSPSPTTQTTTTPPHPPQIVPWNHVWVEGDSADPKNSLDSNNYGPISMSLISGQVMCVLWPRMRMLRWEDWLGSGSGRGRGKAIGSGSGSGSAHGSRVEEDVVRPEKPYDWRDFEEEGV
ncbi:hypothetical protein FQN50_004550 [Emmonsiellopsis sp. PD_5]|nr:hypothetical protein FQN50_004550 [Emmonsiellopsis sp. PD_5]